MGGFRKGLVGLVAAAGLAGGAYWAFGGKSEPIDPKGLQLHSAIVALAYALDNKPQLSEQTFTLALCNMGIMNSALPEAQKQRYYRRAEGILKEQEDAAFTTNLYSFGRDVKQELLVLAVNACLKRKKATMIGLTKRITETTARFDSEYEGETFWGKDTIYETVEISYDPKNIRWTPDVVHSDSKKARIERQKEEREDSIRKAERAIKRAAGELADKLIEEVNKNP